MSYNKPLICPKHNIERVYTKDSTRPSGMALVCKMCVHERNVRHNAEMTPERRRELNDRRNARHTPVYHRNHNLKRSYGLTAEEYTIMFNSQNGLCAICGKPETATNQFGIKSLAVDHDHTTGQVRGLLCSSCNHLIGKAGDNPCVLESAIRYLHGYSCE